MCLHRKLRKLFILRYLRRKLSKCTLEPPEWTPAAEQRSVSEPTSNMALIRNQRYEADNSSSELFLSANETASVGEQVHETDGDFKCDLSCLPYEIHLLLLIHMPDLSSLSAFRLALSVSSNVYKRHEREILASVLQTELRPELVNFLSTCLNWEKFSPGLSMRLFQRSTKLSRQAWPPHKQLRRPLGEWSLIELRFAASLQNAISYCAAAFCKSCLDNWPGKEEQSLELHNLSQTEIDRLYFALYTYELHHRMLSPMTHSMPNWERTYLCRTVFGLTEMRTWEAEMMTCVRNFIQASYEKVASAVNEYSKPYSQCQKCRGWGKSTCGEDNAKRTDQEVVADDYTAAGVSFLAQTLRLHSSKDMSKLKAQLLNSEGAKGTKQSRAFVSNVHYALRTKYRRTEYPNQRAQKLYFSDDNAKIFRKPNEGWTLAHREFMSGEYGESVFTALRSWGYVMWDHERFQEGSLTRAAIAKVAYSRHAKRIETEEEKEQRRIEWDEECSRIRLILSALD